MPSVVTGGCGCWSAYGSRSGNRQIKLGVSITFRGLSLFNILPLGRPPFQRSAQCPKTAPLAGKHTFKTWAYGDVPDSNNNTTQFPWRDHLDPLLGVTVWLAFRGCHIIFLLRGLTAKPWSVQTLFPNAFCKCKTFIAGFLRKQCSSLLSSARHHLLMSEWGCLFPSLPPEPQEATISVAAAFSGWAVSSAFSGVEVEKKLSWQEESVPAWGLI